VRRAGAALLVAGLGCAACADSVNGVTGAGGANSAPACTITATATFSAALPNVARVTWATSLANPTKAEIDFGPAQGGDRMTAPVDLTQPDRGTLLLGMKENANYTYRVVASGDAGSCTSDDYAITTGPIPGAAPAVTATIADPAAHDRGFILTSTGIAGNTAFIIDPDGSVVWAASGPKLPSRVHMSWDGTHMYMMALNVTNTGAGDVQSVAMDGTGATSIRGMAASHHDLTAIPGGFATLLWNSAGKDVPCSLVEYDDGTGATTTVVADMAALYTSPTFHPNSIHYYPADDSYTVGDRNPSLFVKLSRAGELIWQFGGSNPKDPSKFFTNVPAWSFNHGHQLLADGTFLFFNNPVNEAWAYKLNTTTMTATQLWGYASPGAVSSILGDVQRLPNGNFLVTFSTSGVIQEISPAGTLVAQFSSATFGYAEFRESLYGPPAY
jgi:Arylsulfotransferase (ASST)